jgi:N-acetylglucosaminyldiphosphoundecaprenol N-acetyl-beta-D-mannosaminyltransferase
VFRRVELLGGPVDIVSRDEVLSFISGAVDDGRKAIVGNQNLHSLALSRKERRLHTFFRMADLIEIDSMPLVQWGKLLGLQLNRRHRSTYLDWRDAFWRTAAEHRWRVYLLGARDDANAEAASRLAAEWPGITVGGHHGYFDKTAGGAENAAVVAQINAFRPDVLLVAMGMPLQEIWIAENFLSLASGVMLSIGAAFDFEAGFQSPPPRIYGEFCLEWLYRLVHEPRRLFRRYLIEPWGLIAPAMADVARGRALTIPVGRPQRRSTAARVSGLLRSGSREAWAPFPGRALDQVGEGDRDQAVERHRHPSDQPEGDDREKLHASGYPRHVAPPSASAA